MKAIQIHEYGHSDVLRYEEAPMPDIAPTDVLVRVMASAINPVDWKIREGYLKDMIKYEMPLILGWDLSGIIEKVGTEVNNYKPGDAIYCRPDIKRDGAFAEYIAIDSSEIAYKPTNISHAEAASLPLAGITAWETLVTTAKLSQGQKVLIHAGAGGVGTLAIQLAKIRGAYVITTCSEKNRALVESLGADKVIDYRNEDFSSLLKDIDVVLDTIGGEVQNASWKALKKGGMLVSIVSPPPEEKAKEHEARGEFVFIEPNAGILKELASLVDQGKLRPVVGAEFELKDLAQAHALSETGHAVGKIVIHVNQGSSQENHSPRQ